MIRIIRRSTHIGLLAIIVISIIFSAVFAVSQTSYAAVGVNQQLSFAGKIVNSNGTNPPDGTYNMQFKIYQDGTGTGGGALKWTENRLISSGGVTLTSGTFTVNLGSVNPFGASVDWNQDTLWLSMQIGNTSACTITTSFQTNCSGDGEMTPYIRLTAVPQAMNASKLDGLDSTAFGQLASNQIWTGTNTLRTASSSAFQVQNASNNSVLTVDTSSNQVLLGKASTLNGSLVFNNGTNGNTITLQTGTTGASYALSLPTAAPGTSQCLQSGSVTASQLVFGSCSGSVTSLQTAYNSGSTINTTAGGTFAISAGAAPTADIASISNAGMPVTTANANGLSVNYVGGNAAVESSGVRIDYAPGGTNAGTWSGMRIVANTAGPVTGVTSYGLKLEGPATQNGGTSTALYVGTGWDVGLDLQSGGLQLAGISTEPNAPAANNLLIYSKNIAGRMLLKTKGPSGLDTPLQPALFFNAIAMIMPQTGATITQWGMPNATVGTATTPTPTATNLHTSMKRITVTSAATANAAAELRSTQQLAWRGNAAGLGGFFYTCRFGVNSTTANQRVFIGLANTTGAIATTAAPSSLMNTIGVGWDSADTNLQIISNDASGAAGKIDLGASFPTNNTTAMYEFVMYASPNASSIGYRLQRLDTGAIVSGSITNTTDMPASNIFLAPHEYMNNGGTAAAVVLDVNRVYIESDN